MSKQFKDLTFTDDFMFCKVMQDNEDICKGLLESILGFEIGGIKQVENQKSIRLSGDGHGVRFDIFLKDDADTYYDVEMQTCNYSDIAMRSRYYQASIDSHILKKGQRYKQLNKSYIIFIMLKDVFNLGYNIYEFESTCVRDPSLKLDDGAKRIFVNAESVESGVREELGNLISYIKDGISRDYLTERISEGVALAKLDPRTEVDFMTLEEMKEMRYEEGVKYGFEKGIEKGHAEGIAEGVEKGLAEGVEKGFAEGSLKTAMATIPVLVDKGLTLEEACELAGVSVDCYLERCEIN